MKKIIFFFGLLILNNTYADIPTKEFAECSSKKGDLDKIECFDNLAEKYNLNGVQTSKEEIQDQVSGMYLVRAETAGVVSTQKLLLIK